jgi:hypothetical protein
MPKLNKLYSRKEINALREKLIAEHGNQCAICKRPRTEFKNSLSVDHNRKTDRVRGLLCFYCNKMKVGRHSIETAKEILDYLTKYDVPSSKEIK